jgi:X box-binding protein 1
VVFCFFRKLKNRVAAQTARDRKKALMSELEEKVAQLEEEKKLLMKENTELLANTSTLKRENQILKTQLRTLSTPAPTTTLSPAAIPSGQTTCPVESAVVANAASPCKTEPVSPGSAVPAVSLPKEQIQVLSRAMMQYAACALTLR